VSDTEHDDEVTEEEVTFTGEPAEDDTDDGEDDETAEDEETEAEPAEADALARITEIDKKLEGLRKHVARRMSEILGDDAQYYVEDPISRWSGIPGWMPPIDVPPDVAGELYHLLGQHAPSDYQEDAHSAACRSCNGFGEVASGSKVIGQDRLTCVECTGMGWVPTDEARRPRAGAALNGPTIQSPAVSTVASVLPETPEDEDPRAVELRQLGYAVIPPYVAAG
jgi:hypothetical protein